MIQKGKEHAIVRVFLAPSVLSPQALGQVRSRFEYFLAEVSGRFSTNVFLKRVFRSGDYYAIVAVETGSPEKVVKIASEIERRTRMMGSRLRRMLSRAIDFL